MKNWLMENARIIVIVLGISLAFEILFNTDFIFLAFMSGLFLYFGLKMRGKTTGTIMFVIGLFMTFVTLLHSFTLKVILFIFIIYFILRYTNKDKGQPKETKVTLETIDHDQNIQIQTTRFQNRFFGNQSFDQDIFDMDDINIQYGFGDTTIDLSMTIIPPGETIIFIRGIAGNLKLYIPFETEFTLHHSVVMGNVHIFGEERSCFNESIKYETPDYHDSGRKVKILTSVIFGNIEVRNV
ncbi:MAG: cell wall-active antibiotics response protein [Bacillaceae bacterium]|nr:cell wall-active antibiotics response protein [Bacillaceae bacterium]